jgi:Domain of unknown function (DUF3127)
MSLQITGVVKSILDKESGVGKSTGKEWIKQSFVVSFKDGSYDKNVCFTTMKPEIIESISEGQAVTVHFNASSREYNGRWYTDLSAWKVEAGQAQSVVPAPLDEQPNDLPF